MNTFKQDQILDAAREAGLRTIEITTGDNGYPRGLGDCGVIGFNTYAEAEQFCEQNGLEAIGNICQFFQKNGWHFWENRGSKFECYGIYDLMQMLGDGYEYFTSTKDFMDEIANRFDENPFADFDGNFDTLIDTLNNLKEIYTAINNAGEGKAVIVADGITVHETVELESMTLCDDGNGYHYAIGVLVEQLPDSETDNDDDSDDDDFNDSPY